MPKKESEVKIKGLLERECGDDAELYAFLCHTLYEDPISAISKSDLASLMEEAEESIKDKNYRNTMLKYRSALDKTIFEASQNPGEKDRHQIIRDLASKTAKVTEKMREKAEKEGLTAYAGRLEKEIKNCGFLSERVEDVIKIASLYYNERLKWLREAEKAAIEREKKKEG